ncbi:DUF2922 family protein [Enterococcus cecorum]|uniref:DUF2922 family protein n=1 Tax=Enterococcus cecorum TaxID=44008 RepID=UPI003F9367C8
MKKLYLTFENENGKKTSIIPKVFAENLEADVVRQAMDEMAGLAFSIKMSTVYTPKLPVRAT